MDTTKPYTPKQIKEAVKIIEAADELIKSIQCLSDRKAVTTDRAFAFYTTQEERDEALKLIVNMRIKKLRSMRDTLRHEYGVEYDIPFKEIEEKV